jgi:hypothetical protein
MKDLKYILMFIFLCLFLLDVDAQCAMCKAAAASDLESNPNSMAKNINTGILYIMGIPYIILFLLFRKKIVSFARGFFSKT